MFPLTVSLRLTRLCLLVICLALVLSACGATPTATPVPPPPTSTPAPPPTAPPVPPTVTKAPAPTNTPLPPTATSAPVSKGKVLVIAEEKSSDMGFMLANELTPMVNMLEKAGYKVVTASVSGGLLSGGSVSATLKPDLKLADVKVDDYAGVMVPCLAKSTPDPAPQAVEIVRQAVEQGKPVAAQFGGVLTLSAAGVLDGKRFAYPESGKSLVSTKATYAGEGVVQDGKIATSGSCPMMTKMMGKPDGTAGLTQKLIDELALPVKPVVLPTRVPTPAPSIAGSYDVGGKPMTIACYGKGSPVVILEAGLGAPPQLWNQVYPELMSQTTVCPMPLATAEKLHTLLEKAGIPGPYILVSHSMAGLNARSFYSQWPKDVAAIVLVDSSSPGQIARMQALVPAQAASEDKTISDTRNGLAGATGMFAPYEAQPGATASLGSVPLIVLSQTPGTAGGSANPELDKKLGDLWQTMQKELVKLSTNSKQVVATKSGHLIPMEEPATVVNGVLDALKQVKGK